MSPELTFILISLASWRIAHFIAAEDGPFDIVVKVRAKAGDHMLGHLMDCFYCLSLWPSALFAPLLSAGRMEFVLVWLAASGAACILEQATAAKPTAT
jgi:hypothetical protein